eukprot:291202_1
MMSSLSTESTKLLTEKRGKKRTLDEIVTNTIEPTPKRRKISPKAENHIMFKNDESENNENNHANNSSIPNANNVYNNNNDNNNNDNIESIIRPCIDNNKYYDYLSIYTDERCLIHAIPDKEILEEFNERPARLKALISMIREEKWNKFCRFIPSLDDIDIPCIDDIEGLHTKGYLLDLKNSCSKIYCGNWNVAQGSDTYIVKKTFDAALISAGLVMDATKYVFNNNDENNEKNNNKRYAVVLNRPPGHHCDGEKYSGYCYINNIGVAIEKQLNQDTKVLVLDIDVHHGDGTQKLFYNEPTVLTISFHQYDGTFFPTSGLRTEYGPSRRHAAYGTNINIPLDANASDLDVLYALRNMVWKIVEKFKPDIAFYACGTDGIANDKANNSTIFTPNLYGQIAYELTKYCKLIIVTTEGGYTTKYLTNGMNCVLHGLTGQINIKHYPNEFNENDILPSTIHNVAATTSDLRRVYQLKYDPNETNKIFQLQNNIQTLTRNNESIYMPDEDDYNNSDSDLEDDLEHDTLNNEKKKKKKHHKHKHKHKQRKKKNKHKQKHKHN